MLQINEILFFKTCEHNVYTQDIYIQNKQEKIFNNKWSKQLYSVISMVLLP